MLQSILEESFHHGKVEGLRKIRISTDVKELIEVERTIVKDITAASYAEAMDAYYKEMRVQILYAQGKRYGQRDRHKMIMRIKKELYIKLLNYVYQTDEVEVMRMMLHFQDQLKANIDENNQSLCMKCHSDCIKGELYCGQCILEVGYVMLYKRLVEVDKKMSTILFESLASPYYNELQKGKKKMPFLCKSCHYTKETELNVHPYVCDACVRSKTPFIILIATLEGIIKRKDDIQ